MSGPLHSAMHRVVIVGASGYSGGELAGLLARHPRARVVGAFGSARRAGAPAEPAPRLDDLWPRLRGVLDLAVQPADAHAIAGLKPDAVFLCTPHEASLELAPELIAKGLRVLDLSAAFRLKDAALYPRFYGFPHSSPDLLARAVYGMPELFRDEIRRAALVAVPGCYPTSCILPLRPLARAGAIARDARGRPARVIIDSTSGVSGAGRTPTLRSLFCEVSQQAYNVLKHRHNPEIDAFAGTPTLFTAHLGPYERGILSTIHADLAPGWTDARVRDALHEAYARERFVRIRPAASWPSVGDVAHTNFCDIGLAIDDAYDPGSPHLVITSAIDNLVKGAAGQAVQCMNLMLGEPEWSGLFGGDSA